MSYKYFGRLVGNVATATQSLTESAPADTTTPFNPQQPATKFMAYGEDATSLAFNRALAALAGNIDSLSSVLNSVTTKSSVISPLQRYTDSNSTAPGFTGEVTWAKGSLALSDEPTSTAAGALTTGSASISLAGPSGIAPVSWVYVGVNAAELPLNVSFHRVEGQHGTGSPVTVDGNKDLTNISNPDAVEGLQTIYDTFHSVNPSDVFENSSEYNAGTGYSYHRPKYKKGVQAYLTDNASTGIPLYVPPVKRVRTDLAPYNGNERYARISGWNSDGLYMKDYSADELYLRPGCYVEIVGDGSESAQIGNNGLYQIAEIIPDDETTPTSSGSKLILTRGGFHRVTVKDYTQFMEGELVSWRTGPYHQDSGDPTDVNSSAMHPALRTNFAHVGFIVPRPDLYSDTTPDDKPGDLYLRATKESSSFTTKAEDGTPGPYDWSRGVPSTTVGNNRYGGLRTYGSVGLPDKEEDAQQNWNLLPGTFIFHGHAHLFPGDYGVDDWNMGAGAAFGAVVLGPDDGVQNTVIAAGEPVVFSLEEYAGIVYPCAPPGFVLNPVFSLDPRKSVYSGSYQAHVKTLTTVREKLVAESSPNNAVEGLSLESGLSYADAKKLQGWQYFIRTGFDDAADQLTGVAKDYTYGLAGNAIRHPVADGLNGPSSPTAQVLGNSLWEVKVHRTTTGAGDTLSDAFSLNNWGCFGAWAVFEHPDSQDTYSDGTAKPTRAYYGKVLSAVSDPSDPTRGTVLIGSLNAGPQADHLSHDHLSVLGSGGWPIQSSTQNASYSKGGHAGGSRLYASASADIWSVEEIVKAPTVSAQVYDFGGVHSIPFVPSHGLNAAYHNHFSASPLLRNTGDVFDPDSDLVHGATGHIIHTNPRRPLTLSLPTWSDFEQGLRIRAEGSNITLLRLDSNRDSYDDLTDIETASSLHEARIGWYQTYTPIRKLEVDLTGTSPVIESHSLGDRSAASLSLEESLYSTDHFVNISGYLRPSLTFGSANISQNPLWYKHDSGWQAFDPDGYSVAQASVGQTGTTPGISEQGRRDVALDSTYSQWAEDNFNLDPSRKQAVYNNRHTPQESQDRSIFGALEATVLGNYNFDVVNQATKSLFGVDSIEIGEALMGTEHQFGVLSNGVIAGGYCWALCNETTVGSQEKIPAHLMRMHTSTEDDPSGFETMANWALGPIGPTVVRRSVLFYDAYVLVGGTKWHVPSQMLDLSDYAGAGGYEDSEFLVFFDARARRLLIKKKPAGVTDHNANVAGVEADWSAAESWYYGLLEDAHVTPFAKVVTDGGGLITKVINLRKPIARIDERTHLLVGVCSKFEKKLKEDPTTRLGQQRVESYKNAQMHFQTVSEALVYIEEMNKAQTHQTRQWTIEVVGSCYEKSDPARGIELPQRFPAHGINIIGHKGTSHTFLKNVNGSTTYGGSTLEIWPVHKEGEAWTNTDSKHTSIPAAVASFNGIGGYGIVLGNQEDGGLVVWDEPVALFDLNSRHGVSIRDLNIEYRGGENGQYWEGGWNGVDCTPRLAAFICTRKVGDPTLPALDSDRGNVPFGGHYGDPMNSNAAFSGNYLFEGVTLHNGGILVDFYSHEPTSQTKASLDNIVLRNCRAINVTHGLAAFGCSQNVAFSSGHDGDAASDSRLASQMGLGVSKTEGAWKKYHRGVTIEGCEATCVPSGPTAMWGQDRHPIFEDDAWSPGTMSASARSRRRSGVFATHTKELTIRNCSFSGAFSHGVYLGQDVHWLSKGWVAEEQHWSTGRVVDCTINGPLEVGVYAASRHANSNISIKGNTIRDCGWPYWEPNNTDGTVSGARVCLDAWGVFTDANGVDISGNQIRSIVYSNENYGVDNPLGLALDQTDEHMTGGIYAKVQHAFYWTVRPIKISGNTLELIGKAPKGIVLPDQYHYTMGVSSNATGALITDNTINIEVTVPYKWSSNMYDFQQVDSDSYADAFDAASADMTSLGVNYPFSLFVGQGHTHSRVTENYLSGPVVFAGMNSGTIFTSNTVTDPCSRDGGTGVILPESDSLWGTQGCNTSLVAFYQSSRLTITGNVVNRGHLHLDEVTYSMVSSNNLQPMDTNNVAQMCEQPIGVFLRAECHQNQINQNSIPGNGFIIVGSTGDCHDNSIVGNKWGKRGEPVIDASGDYRIGDISVPYYEDLVLPWSGTSADSIHFGGLFYWRGNGSVISDNTLLNNDIMVGNYTFDMHISWEGYSKWALDSNFFLGDDGIGHRSGAGHSVQGNKLGGGSIHIYADGCKVSGNDLCRVNGDGRVLSQKIYGGPTNTYHPNIELVGDACVVESNMVPGDIWVQGSDGVSVSDNTIGGDLIANNCDGVVIQNNNLSVINPKQPVMGLAWLSSGELDWSSPVHSTGMGCIVVQHCDKAVIRGNVSLMGLEEKYQTNNLYLLGVPTNEENHLYYADHFAPFTGRMYLDLYLDVLAELQAMDTAARDVVLQKFRDDGYPRADEVDASSTTAEGMAYAMIVAMSWGLTELNDAMIAWYETDPSNSTLYEATYNDVDALINARWAAEEGNKNIIGGNHSKYWGTQPEPGSSDCPSTSTMQNFIRSRYGEGCHDDGNIGPFYPLNMQSSAYGAWDHYKREWLKSPAYTPQQWGRYILALDSDEITISDNKLSLVETNDCRGASITNNRLFWGGFNPGYVAENSSILVSGDVGRITIKNNECSGSIWIKDNFAWGAADDQNTSYSYGSIHFSSDVSQNSVGNKHSTVREGSAYYAAVGGGVRSIWGGEAITAGTDGRINNGGSSSPARFSSRFFYGGGGCIVIDNCTRLTAIGNDCNSYLGALPDRWFDQLAQGGEWGEIYVNRLGNPFYMEYPEGSTYDGKWHRQNFGTVITNNKAAGVMGWVRQPTSWMFSGALKEAVKSNLDNLDVHAPHLSETGSSDIFDLMDFVIPCIGASYGEWTGNRMSADVWAYSTDPTCEITSLDSRWRSAGTHGLSNNWWGNMDSWTGPAQANGVMTENAVPTCTGEKWFGNPNYYVK